jgi:hypothetical protein
MVDHQSLQYYHVSRPVHTRSRRRPCIAVGYETCPVLLERGETVHQSASRGRQEVWTPGSRGKPLCPTFGIKGRAGGNNLHAARSTTTELSKADSLSPAGQTQANRSMHTVPGACSDSFINIRSSPLTETCDSQGQPHLRCQRIREISLSLEFSHLPTNPNVGNRSSREREYYRCSSIEPTIHAPRFPTSLRT